ncbi:hypothetical protein EV359DRAFT_60443 [Lentinula novae-zelandiae]|uniref:DUF7330 domain-containing protein n=1 Tax=Lentinula lateritia TaxID=40482 RepID=A0ABQ8V605_9AGAR|nr:hypothetical protein EV359DRAFT_60443 [Lentinula novae-zelandiae]KAJ4467507.1 hypothetical protein C8R41DRAFT_871380 [Lentinula lateritia]
MLMADHFTINSASTSTFGKEQNSLLRLNGPHKVTYQAKSDWDYYVDVTQRPINMDLILPHYRPQHQPTDHRLNMFVGTEAGPVKLKLCRSFARCKFYLEVQASMSDVTLWLPSDFKGRIQYSGKAKFSSGFINRVMQNVYFSGDDDTDATNEDCLVVVTNGNIMFRMWDVQTCAPENTQKETLKRMFGCSKKAPETSIDWDFLLED